LMSGCAPEDGRHLQPAAAASPISPPLVCRLPISPAGRSSTRGADPYTQGGRLQESERA
jgi:hypothetical protein